MRMYRQIMQSHYLEQPNATKTQVNAAGLQGREVGEPDVAWDFSTEPEFQEQLDRLERLCRAPRQMRLGRYGSAPQIFGTAAPDTDADGMARYMAMQGA